MYVECFGEALGERARRRRLSRTLSFHQSPDGKVRQAWNWDSQCREATETVRTLEGGPGCASGGSRRWSWKGKPAGRCVHALGPPAGGSEWQRGGRLTVWRREGQSQPSDTARGGEGFLAASPSPWPHLACGSVSPVFALSVDTITGPQTILIRSGLILTNDMAKTLFPSLTKGTF